MAHSGGPVMLLTLYVGFCRFSYFCNRVKLVILLLVFYWRTLLFDVVRFMDLVGAGLVVLLTWSCLKLGIYFNYNPSMVVAAVIFPIAFCVNAAYGRREQSLLAMAKFKGSCLTIIAQHGAWSRYFTPDKPQYQQFTPEGFYRRTVQLLDEIQDNLGLYLSDISNAEKVVLCPEARTKTAHTPRACRS